MILIAAGAKFWAFSMAEQFEIHGRLTGLFTTFHEKKNPAFARFIKRRDDEEITLDKIHTAPLLAIPMRLRPKNAFLWNDWFDRWVASQIQKQEAKFFIGWSGMSLRSLRAAKQRGMITILERGSSHILYQNDVLKRENAKYGRQFNIDPRVIGKELQEYEEADYIDIPSSFVYRSFVENGIPPSKLLVNPYGYNNLFKPDPAFNAIGKFIILYFGSISIRKGVDYLFKAIDQLNFSEGSWEAWFIGGIQENMETIVEQRKSNPHFRFFGHMPHEKLNGVVANGSVAVFPSVEDGFGMVIVQALASGIPVITTTETGGPDVIIEGKTGFIVPPANPDSIAEKLRLLYRDRDLLATMHRNAPIANQQQYSWDEYGKRFVGQLENLPQ